jgi:hypothetical protein
VETRRLNDMDPCPWLATLLAPTRHPPLMLINSGLSPDRQRFTILHELGQLVMHVFPAENQENEANQFASEFLTPAAEVEPDLRGLTAGDFRRLMELQSHWKVSIGMLIQRAKDLGCISDRQFKEFRVRLSRMGWHSSEPVDLPAEEPSVVPRAITILGAGAEMPVRAVGLTTRVGAGPTVIIRKVPRCSSCVAMTRARRRTTPHPLRRSFEVGHPMHTAAHGPPRTYKRGFAVTAHLTATPPDLRIGVERLQTPGGRSRWVPALRAVAGPVIS